MNFYTLKYSDNPDYCAIYNTPLSMPYRHRSCTGMRVGDQHESSFPFQMAREVSGKLVPDLIRQVIGQFLVTRRVAQMLKSIVNCEVEFLSTTLLNHKKKPVKEDVVLVNVIGWYDCLNRKDTQGKPLRDLTECERTTAMKKNLPRQEYDDQNFPDEEYLRIGRLSLHPDRTPTDVNIFRLSSFISAIVFREDVVSCLEKEKVTGATFIPIGQPVEIS